MQLAFLKDPLSCRPNVLISVHERCYVCKTIQEQSLQCSSSVTMWIRELSQLTLTVPVCQNNCALSGG